MGLLTKLGKTVIKAADKAQDINKQMSLDLPEIIEDTPIKTSVVTDDLADEATEMLGNKEAIDNWKKENKVPKEESKRRKQRKFSKQAKDLQAGIMSGPEYRKYIRENQPATSFTPEDLKTMMPNFKQVVGALTKDKSDSGILGLNSSLDKGNIVSSRLDIPAYNEHDIWVTSIVDKEKGKLYGRTAVLKNVNFDMTNRGAKKLALDIATEAKKTKKVLDKETGERVPQEFTQTKTPFATMKGEWQDFSDKDAFALAEKYINDPEWIQVGFNPERHSFFYDKETMMPVFNADAVVQIGALVLAKVPKLTTPALKAERINKLRKLRIDNMPEGARPATFKEGGLVPMDNQMNFALGGLNDEGGEIDEVSGNRVPIGGTKEGVRDDIEISISEGEFVFPEDVVRYIGLDKLMKIRQDAKIGLKKMEAMGQMGNSDEATLPDDLPFTASDLIVVGDVNQPMEFNEGGFVVRPLPIQNVPTSSNEKSDYSSYANSSYILTKEFKNAKGDSTIITFINGEPVIPIPEGYVEVVKGNESEEANIINNAVKEVEQNFNDDGAMQRIEREEARATAIDYSSMSSDQFFDRMKYESTDGYTASQSIGVGIALLIPKFGGVTQAALKIDQRQKVATMQNAINNLPDGPKKQEYQAILNGYEESKNFNSDAKKGILSSIVGEVSNFLGEVASVAGLNLNINQVESIANNATTAVITANKPASNSESPNVKKSLRPEFNNQTDLPITDASQPPMANTPYLGEDAINAMQSNITLTNPRSGDGKYFKKGIKAREAGASPPLSTDFQQSASTKPAPKLINPKDPRFLGGDRPAQVESRANQADIKLAQAEDNLEQVETQQKYMQNPVPTLLPEEMKAVKDRPDELSFGSQGFEYDPNTQSNIPRQKSFEVSPNMSQLDQNALKTRNQFKSEASEFAIPDPSNVPTLTVDSRRPDMLGYTQTRDSNIPTTPVVSTLNPEEFREQERIRSGVPTFKDPEEFREQERIRSGVPTFKDPVVSTLNPEEFREQERIRSGVPTFKDPASTFSKKPKPVKITTQERKRVERAKSLIPDRVRFSDDYVNAKNSGFTGSSIGGYAVGKISGDKDPQGVMVNDDGKVTKVRDLRDKKEYGGISINVSDAATVFKDINGVEFVKTGLLGRGRATLDGKKYTGPGIKNVAYQQRELNKPKPKPTRKQKANKEGTRYNVKDDGTTYKAPADPEGNKGGFKSFKDMFDGGGPGESAEEEVKRGGGDGGYSFDKGGLLSKRKRVKINTSKRGLATR